MRGRSRIQERAMKSPKNQQVLDEKFDAAISRPLARGLGRWFHHRGWSADRVSIVAIIFGVSAGVCIAGTGLWPILGGLLLVSMVILDCTDGEVARLNPNKEKPWRGRILDGWCDFCTIVSVHVGMVIHLDRTGLSFGGYQLSTLEIVLIGVLGFAAFTWKSSVLDDIKQRLRDASPDHDLSRFEAQPKTRFERFLFWSLKVYVRSAARATGHGRPGGADTFRQASWVGPSHHLVAIAVAGILTPFSSTAYLTYFVLAILPASIYLWGVLARARRIHAEAKA
jgi:hypothetical protein